MTVQEREKEIYRKGMEELNKPIERPTHHRRRIHRPGAGGYYRPAIGGAIYNIYPIMYPKGADYCPQMRGIFRFTCQPSKPLRLDLVEFCKEYSSFCGVINTHRLPGPGIGPPPDSRSMGHVGVNVGFGFSIGSGAFLFRHFLYVINYYRYSARIGSQCRLWCGRGSTSHWGVHRGGCNWQVSPTPN